jgi:hypothetical protein
MAVFIAAPRRRPAAAALYAFRRPACVASENESTGRRPASAATMWANGSVHLRAAQNATIRPPRPSAGVNRARGSQARQRNAAPRQPREIVRHRQPTNTSTRRFDVRGRTEPEPPRPE